MKNQTKRNPVTITNYEKKFEDFASMIKELESLHPEIDSIFNQLPDEEINPVNAIFCLIDYMNTGLVPDVLTGTNLPSALSFSANRANLKTIFFISFGWSFKYSRNKEISDIVATITTYSKENNNPEALQYTMDVVSNAANGWTVVSK